MPDSRILKAPNWACRGMRRQNLVFGLAVWAYCRWMDPCCWRSTWTCPSLRRTTWMGWNFCLRRMISFFVIQGLTDRTGRKFSWVPCLPERYTQFRSFGKLGLRFGDRLSSSLGATSSRVWGRPPWYRHQMRFGRHLKRGSSRRSRTAIWLLLFYLTYNYKFNKVN